MLSTPPQLGITAVHCHQSTNLSNSPYSNQTVNSIFGLKATEYLICAGHV